MDEKTVIRIVRGRHRIHTHPHGDRGEKKEGFLRRITTGLLERTVKKGRGGIDFRMKKTPIDRTEADGSEKKISALCTATVHG